VTTPPERGLAVQLVSRPDGPLKREHLAIVQAPTPHLPPGWVLVHNRYAALDPLPLALAARHWPLRTALSVGSTIGEVVASRSADLPRGSLIAHRGGWSTYSALPRGGHSTRTLKPPAGVPADAYLTILGLPGIAAHVSLTKVLGFRSGESLFIADAIDPIGTVTAQIARMLGASLIVGAVASLSDARAAEQYPYFDVIFDRSARQAAERDPLPPAARVDAAVVGASGAGFSDALHWVRDRGRVAWVDRLPSGSAKPLAALDLSVARRRGIRIEGFGLQHHLHRFKEVEYRYLDELRAGRLQHRRSIEVDMGGLIDILVSAEQSGSQRAATYRLVDGQRPP
jgi:NADPH-dependent curcumin reductase CurA